MWMLFFNFHLLMLAFIGETDGLRYYIDDYKKDILF